MMFTKEQLTEMIRHACEEYPRECVGAIIGLGDTPDKNEIIRLRNIQDELLKKDPAHFNRDSRTGYFVDPKEVMALSNRARNGGKMVKAFYHSHPDHDSYFSKEDMAGAVMFDEPTYPGAVYVVISVFGGRAKSAQVFAWDGKTYSPSESLQIDN
ncbi:MAG: M67 family metallopeptidase [Nitrospinae bacterium]|nr:M67 family metallopeptidase [Nitrospinota bacterium]